MTSNMQCRNQFNLISVNDFKNSDIKSIFEIADSKKFNVKNGGLGISLFFENSTRTLLSFESALLNCGLKSVRFDVSSSSIAKEETVINTIRTINSYSPDFLIMRSKQTGEPLIYQKYLDSNTKMINAGDGTGEHPTQALLDFYTILQVLNIKFSDSCLKNITIAIAGDIMHSRVARSNIFLLSRFGAKIILISPLSFLPQSIRNFYSNLGCSFAYTLREIKANFVMLLRIQKERMEGKARLTFPSNFGIFNEADLNHAYLMHPGPINERVEITEDMAYLSSKSLISKQVENGSLIRSAIIKFLSDK